MGRLFSSPQPITVFRDGPFYREKAPRQFGVSQRFPTVAFGKASARLCNRVVGVGRFRPASTHNDAHDNSYKVKVAGVLSSVVEPAVANS